LSSTDKEFLRHRLIGLIRGSRPIVCRVAGRVLYSKVAETVRSYAPAVEQGIFKAHMQVESVNDGPATLLVDSELSRSAL